MPLEKVLIKQTKDAKLAAHYRLFKKLFGDKFPESNFVPGDGNPDAKVVFVGEAPGFNENEECRPFVGASGKELAKWLKSIGLKREDVFITNFLKYKPPNNRDPKGDEIPVCTGLLRMELKILNPQLVVTLGRYSTSLFWENPHMGTLAGQVHTRRGFTVLPMYHPAAALYDTSGDTGILCMEHIKMVAKVLGIRPRVRLEKVARSEPKKLEKVSSSSNGHKPVKLEKITKFVKLEKIG